MLLTHLKYWRELPGYSLRELADKSKVPYSAISLLENGKREPQGRTSLKLAAALEVDLTALYSLPAALEPTQLINGNKTITVIKPARTRTKKQQAGNCWVIDHEGDAFGPFVEVEAERLKGKLGQARVYEAANKAEARELHRQFLIRVARGHDAW
jgi:transcriptional regulator with XRE-family HTH domain